MYCTSCCISVGYVIFMSSLVLGAPREKFLGLVCTDFACEEGRNVGVSSDWAYFCSGVLRTIFPKLINNVRDYYLILEN